MLCSQVVFYLFVQSYFMKSLVSSFFFNFIFTEGYKQQALMDVIDLNQHLEDGKVKDACLLARSIIPIMLNIDLKFEEGVF